MAFANDFNNWALATYAQQNFSELFLNKDVQKLKWLQALYPLLQSGLNFGLDKIIENLLNTISNPVLNNGNWSTRFNEAWNNLTNTNNSIQEAINAKIPGYKTELFLNELNNFKIESPELKLNELLSPSNPMDLLSLNDTSLNNGNNSLNNLGLSFKQGLSTSAGVIAGAGVGYGLSALGNKLLGNSKGANFTTGAISQLGSTVAGNVAGTLASNALGTSTQTVGLGLSSLGSAASLTSGAAALGNIALDAFDPVKKHWSENVVGLGGAVASLAIPGAGPFIASGLLAANAVGHILGDKTLTYTRDSELESQIGASYGGFLHDSAKADALADTKYSAFNSAARRKDDKFISDVKRMMSGLTGIRDLALDKFTIKNSMAAINGNRRALELQGGFLQGTVHAAKHGGRIQKILAKYKEGGSINNAYQEFLNSFPPEEQGLISDGYRMYDYWNYNGRPKYFEDAVVKGMFNIDSKGKYHANTIAWNPETGEGEFMKSSKHPTLWREEEYYNGNEVVLKEGKEDNGNKENYDIIPLKGEELAKWKLFVSKYKLDKSGEYYKYIPIKEFKEGGSIENKTRSIDELIEYAKQQNPRFILRLSEGKRGVYFIDNDGNNAQGSHYMSWTTDENGNGIVFPEIQEVDGQLIHFGKDDWRNAYFNAINTGNYLSMSPEEAKLFSSLYKQGWPDFFSYDNINHDAIREYYKDYDLNGINFIIDNSPRTENNTIYISNTEDAIHELWHYLSLNKPNSIYKEFYDNLNDNRIIELGGDIDFVKRFENDPGYFYHPSELEARLNAAKYMTQGLSYDINFFLQLRSNENKYGNNMRDLLHMYNDENLVKLFNIQSPKKHKNGGTIINIIPSESIISLVQSETIITPIEFEEIQEFKEGGSFNIIPDGALHAHLHHMKDADNLTKKGIPVVSESENGELEQQAEIEREEIIFRLEVTKKLEELAKEGTDEAAIEAGKLLVYEILNNTIDNTDLLNTIN